MPGIVVPLHCKQKTKEVMNYFIEVLDDNFEVVKVHKTQFPTLRKAMARIFDLQLKGNVQIVREDNHYYNVIVYPTGVVAECETTGKRYTY